MRYIKKRVIVVSLIVIILIVIFLPLIIFGQDTNKLVVKPYGFLKGDMVYATAGVYSFDMYVTTTTTNNVRSVARSYLECDSGGGFVEVLGTSMFTYNRNADDGENTGSSSGSFP